MLTLLELAAHMTPKGKTVTPTEVLLAAQDRSLPYDQSGVTSALIKSIRGNDPDAAIWWLATALEGGEDPRVIARRLLVSASEDVGNADPAALPLAVAAEQLGYSDTATFSRAFKDWTGVSPGRYAKKP